MVNGLNSKFKSTIMRINIETPMYIIISFRKIIQGFINLNVFLALVKLVSFITNFEFFF